MARQVTVRSVETPEVAKGEPPSDFGNGTSPDPAVPQEFSVEAWDAITRLWHFLPDYPTNRNMNTLRTEQPIPTIPSRISPS